MAVSIINYKVQFARVYFSSQITNGYVRINNSAVTGGRRLFFAPEYQGTASAESMQYIYTVQGQAGSAIIYVRKGDGTIPADGKTVSGTLYIDITG